jgi:hypothetical protein
MTLRRAACVSERRTPARSRSRLYDILPPIAGRVPVGDCGVGLCGFGPPDRADVARGAGGTKEISALWRITCNIRRVAGFAPALKLHYSNDASRGGSNTGRRGGGPETRPARTAGQRERHDRDLEGAAERPRLPRTLAISPPPCSPGGRGPLREDNRPATGRRWTASHDAPTDGGPAAGLNSAITVPAGCGPARAQRREAG